MNDAGVRRAPSPQDSSAAMFGVLGLGPSRIALDLALLREVVPMPSEFQQLPTRARGLIGALPLRDLVVPVVDVRPFVGMTDDRAAEQVVAIVVHGGKVLGVLVDGIVGLTSIDKDRTNAISTGAGSALLFSSCIEHPEHGLVSIIDGSTLFSLPGVPTVADSVGQRNGHGDAAGSATDSLVLFRVGDVRVAIPVEDIHSVLPEVDLRPSLLQGGNCLGVTNFLGAAVPVADVLMLVGLGTTQASDVRQGIAIRDERGFVAIGVTEVLDIVPRSTGVRLDLPPIGLRRPEAFTELWSGRDGTHFFAIDGAALRRDPDISAMTGLNVSASTPTSTATFTSNPEARHGAASRPGSSTSPMAAGIVFLRATAGIEFVTPLADVAEIIRLGTDVLTVTDNDAGVVVLLPHRGEVMPIVDLASALGQRPVARTSESPIVSIAHGAGHIGFLVDALGAIEPSIWEEAAPPSIGPDDLRSMTSTAQRVRTDGSSGLLPVVDLTAVATLVAPVDAPHPETLEVEGHDLMADHAA